MPPDLHAREIRWTPEPIPRLPVGRRIHDLVLAAHAAELPELLSIAALDAQEDAESFRVLAHSALTQVAEQRVEIERQQRRIESLCQEVRDLRARKERASS